MSGVIAPYHERKERHRINRTAWLRAAVLGANDGIISISSLIIGVASASAAQEGVALAGIAGLVAGAMSMAAGEYVSVCSQVDLEKADLRREQRELNTMPEEELNELAEIYEARGVSRDLAMQVAIQMTEHDALGAHAREELGITELSAANPLQAALASGLSFSLGGVIPIIGVFMFSHDYFMESASALCLLLLGGLGAFSAIVGGSSVVKPSLRLMFWGALAMGVSSIIGRIVGISL